MNKLTRRQLELTNRRTLRYPLQVAEKDYFLATALGIAIDEAVETLKQKEIRTPVIVANIARNWSVAKEQMDRDLGSIYCSEEVANREIENLIQSIQFDDIETPR